YDRDDRDKCRFTRGSVVCGPRTVPTTLDTQRQEFVIGVQFKPGGAVPFFGLPTRELANAHVALADLWGAAADELREQLLETKTPRARLLVLENTLLRQLVRPITRHPAVDFALRAFQSGPCPINVGQVASRTGFSQRRFIQVFHDEVGITPKLFCRLRRFHDALCQIQGARKPDWIAIALDCGYFDQAHLIRDFLQFAGLTPAGYARQRGEHRYHVPVEE
ncbi:MAG: helix-turn-helix domain-containing protein, partial [Candidatus Saccharimonadales bacterium]